MKKKLLLFIILLIPFKVKAETILDNYKIDISIDSKEATVSETFKVIETIEKENNYDKKLLIYQNRIKNLDTNIENYELLSEDENTSIIIGNIKNNKKYYIKYKIPDFTIYGTHIYDFNPPENTKILNLSFEINYQDLEYCNIIGYQDDDYQITYEEENIKGELKENASSAFFTINGAPLKEIENNTNIYDESDMMTLGEKSTIIISIITIIIALVVGIILLKEKELNKKKIRIYALSIVAMMLLPIIIKKPVLIFYFVIIVPFYGVFYYFLFYNPKEKYDNRFVKIFMENFIFLFLAIHSYAFIGMFAGIIPHILNNIALYISALTYRKYINK